MYKDTILEKMTSPYLL